jgi:hypothetical protein
MRNADATTRTVATTRILARATVIMAAASLLAAPFVTVAGAVVPPGLVNPPNRPMQTQHAFKCQKLTNKNVAKYLSTWSKIYTKCVGSIAACVQTKDSDPDCLAKAAATCNAKIPTLGNDLDKDAGTVLENSVTDFCGSLSPTEAFDDEGGPRFALLGDTCHSRFGFTPTIIQSYASCLFRETNCVAEQLFLFQMPRARDLLVAAGVNVGHALTSAQSCLTNQNGSGALPDPKAGKALLKCQKSADKAGVSFASKARGAFAKSADAVMNCAQLKPTQKCVDGAAKTCTKALAAVDAGEIKAEDAVTKACTKIPLDDLFDVNGGAVGTLVTLCNGVGVSPLTTLADYASCLAKHERCQVEDSITFTVPRINEFLTAAGQSVSLPSAFCPAP